MEHRTGGCHCKKVTYETNIDLANPVIECNCSKCQISGLLLTAAKEEDFTLLTGKDNLTEYRFNTEKITHFFCKTCGVEPFAQGPGPDGVMMSMVNVRTIDDIDLASLTRMPFDGKSR